MTEMIRQKSNKGFVERETMDAGILLRAQERREREREREAFGCYVCRFSFKAKRYDHIYWKEIGLGKSIDLEVT